ncbi:histidine kinase [Streptomonospora nanhaiensis]|uniref:Histidine kinase n=1 Tax=Streptomonospora nanhaiensis TaxID=1323731 RepID=A0ABY6YEY8_9ACTN|nr:histidine kinase [Streptomonospora nanhaiensis]WAE70803.1 histidine kinase [Streptomonospora nanhaiensis]
MTDPSSFGAALWTLLIVATLVVALGVAAVSDMAMRRREDRAARKTPATGPGSRSASPAARAPQAGATAGGVPDRDAAERR